MEISACPYKDVETILFLSERRICQCWISAHMNQIATDFFIYLIFFFFFNLLRVVLLRLNINNSGFVSWLSLNLALDCNPFNFKPVSH